jgi:pimeloyl-ACP methyl ester carboxylesterase
MMMLATWSLRLIVFLTILAAISYPAADWMRVPMDDAARAALTQAGKADRFVPLTAGVMHVRVQGPEDGPSVLLVHGATIGGFAFDRWIKPLSEAGFRVIVPDMFGYGYSDRPTATYDKAFYMTQLSDLLDRLNVTGPLHIVGSSMGGAITSDFVAANAARIRSVTLIAPAGLGALEAQRLPIARLFVAPVIGDWIARVPGASVMTGTIAQSDIGGVEGIADWMGEQARYRGFAEGQLSTFRHYDIANRLEAYEALGRSGLPVLALWGTADTVVPFLHSEELLRRAPQAKLVPVEGAPHGLPLLQPEEMIAIVLPFLNAQNAPGAL